ncbi:ABC transporter permease [Xanthomonas hortorum]|uniref:Macrolide export ATP-binding/permease protein MacB n=3 Tax=Xanthomonas hortorum TaxID=56454 RepID=A0A6V7EMG8_9XANT|nr:ABC transporter permease [Xanthomonas hortorum]MCC4626825.1 ABC transporter permease [Xanthomonas campestris pv. nigromaculans]APP79346.1 ABC transporter ATP-binding protein [Xanthomonas hortorum pv. gardneri]EGD19240.1 ABC-type antimicrobial peptide transport system, permease component [Xanthomonas hortorum ATCC 19865]KLA96904.1 ABC transporter ATP-binding protein [Xanthomonas hortorum pv. gardneri]KLB02735.1 ABC transporter ATP-binding protein [Xanthomonas hortorum pv. gardneri]
MFGYYFTLAVRSFRRNKILTALMVLAIALGIGASMTTLTVFYILSGDPIPQKSERLFIPQIDARSPGHQSTEALEQLTRFDAENLLREKRGDLQAMMSGGSVPLEPDNSSVRPMKLEARYTSADFFPMFNPPFLYGGAWTANEDGSRARVAVITEELNKKLFNGENSVGRTLRINRQSFRIVGVLREWRLTPKFYDLSNSSYAKSEQLFVPFSAAMELKFQSSGSRSCWGDSKDANSTDQKCSWIQYWVQLDSPQKAAAYRQYLENYSDQQRRAGRFERPTNVQLRSVMQWMDYKKVVPSDVRLQTWLALGFLLVCLVNTVGLLLAKFMRRSGEIGVRRALGATKRSIFAQSLVEAGMIGLAGGILGLGLATLGLWGVRQQPSDYAELAHLDPLMLLVTFALALLASVVAGLLPAWRACSVPPAIQLKAQ